MGGNSYGVAQLAEELRDFLSEAYPQIWVAGETQRIRRSQRGHVYFELIEKGRGDQILGKLDAVAWRGDFTRIRRELAAAGQELTDGQTVRCRVDVDFYPAGGRLQLIVREVDPVFTLGLLEKRRRETFAALERAGLLELNQRLVLSSVPLSIGLVTSKESAAYHDFLSTLEESGLGFRVVFVHAAMQGREAEREVVSALRLLGELGTSDAPGASGTLNAIALVRGGGSRTDLAAFDSRAIAEAVARSPLPVLTGLGHEIDQAIADATAHTALKTPTKAAEHLVERVEHAEALIEASVESLHRLVAEHLLLARERCERYAQIGRLAERRLAEARRIIDGFESTFARAGLRGLAEARRRVEQLTARLGPSATRTLGRYRGEPERLGQRLVTSTMARLREARAVLDGHARVCVELRPERALERGYSITRDDRGRIVREPEQLKSGEVLHSQLVGGTVRSRVLAAEKSLEET